MASRHTASRSVSTSWLVGLSLFAVSYLWAPLALLAESSLGREQPGKRREWRRAWSGARWSQAYRRFVYGVALKHRWLHGKTLPLALSTIRGMALPRAAVGNHWINLGPTQGGPAFNVREGNDEWKLEIDANDSGRPNQIVLHPNEPSTLYLVTSGGGLWRTTDGGKTWNPLTDTLGSLSLGALAIDPAQPSVLYLGLGDVEENVFGGTGSGIVKSVDNGVTWGLPIALGDSSAVISLVVHPKRSTLVLAGTDHGLFRSVDSGATYQAIPLPNGSPSAIRDISWIRDDTFLMTAGNNFSFGEGGGNAAILISSDGGGTWSTAAGLGDREPIRRFSLAIAPSDHRIAYALASNTQGELHDLFVSSDGGRHWRAKNVQNTKYGNAFEDRQTFGTLMGGQGGYNQIAAVDPRRAQTVYFGGNFNIVKSTDAGDTFSIVSDWAGDAGLPYVHADFHCATFDRTNALWIGNDGGLARTIDGGATWSTAENKGLATHLVYSLGSSSRDRDVVIAGFQDNGTRLRLEASGAFQQRIYADGFGAIVHPNDQKLLLGSVYNDRILKSTDGGITFHGSYAGISEAGTDQAPFYTHLIPWSGDVAGNTVFTFSRDKLYRSSDFGDTWSPTPIPGLRGRLRNFAIAATDRNVLGVVTESNNGATNNPGGLYLSKDGGTTWSPAANLPGNKGSLSYISFAPTRPETVYAASIAASASAHHLWRSDNSGQTWTPIDVAPNFPQGIPINVVVGDPGDAETIYAGTHLGLYKSTDSGTHWTRFGFGLPLVSVTDIYVTSDSSLLRVATYGRGIWELTQ